MSQILTESEASFGRWRDRLQSAVGDLGRVLTEVVPSLQGIIGDPPSVPPLGGQESENRFNYVFINLLSAIATREHPLVLFIDDLQWVDAASLRLLKVIQSDFSQPGLLLIGAYRSNEVPPSHPLMEVIGDRRTEGISPRILELDNLHQRHLDAFLSDSLVPRTRIRELASSIFQKTQGNPFFARRLLSSLNDEGRIRFDPETASWSWDIADIKSAAAADSVAVFLSSRISQLPEDVRSILTLAACIGNRFDIPTLSMISGIAEQEARTLLRASASGRYVVASGNTYAFAHDQVQKAAYSLMDAESRNRKHLEIARLFMAHTGEPELDERIFEIVTHYNLGASLLRDDAEKRQVAELNLRAGRKSRTSSAFSAAAEYLKEAVCMLGDNRWRDEYELTLDVHNELIDAYYLSFQREETKDLFDTIVEHARNDIDLWMAYRTTDGPPGAHRLTQSERPELSY